MKLKGIYTPIATPFSGEKIAFDKLEENLSFWNSSKLEGLVVMGSNGEAVSFREAEKEEMIRFCCKHSKGKKKVIIGTGSNSTSETLHLCNVAAENGADAMLVITPYFYKGGMSDSVLNQYYTEVADKSPLPIVIYNMPPNTGVNTSASLLTALSKHPNIIGVKDTGGNIMQIAETIKGADPSFAVFAGNWGFFFPSLMLGAQGATVALGNILPNECHELIELVEKGEIDKAREHAFKYAPVNNAITAKYGIGGLKIAMEFVGLHGGEPRSPLRRPGKEAVDDIRGILERAGVSIKK